MSQCNYCRFKSIQRRGKEEGKKIRVKVAKNFGMGVGVDIYLLDPGEEIQPDNEKGENPQRVAWFMELPNRCCC